jgi:hypothetical protein
MYFDLRSGLVSSSAIVCSDSIIFGQFEVAW